MELLTSAWTYIGNILSQMSIGIGNSLLIFVMTLLFSLPLGLLVSFGRMSRCKIINLFFKFYISIMRGTPLMLQIIVIFFAPYYLFGLPSAEDARFPIILAFILNYAAYFAEIYRGGIESISKGQYEAAAVLGLSKTRTFLRIILPQVIKNILPSITNEIITLVKDTSLAQILLYEEMFSMASAIASAQCSVAPLMVAGLFYYVFNLLIAFVMERVENKLNYYR